MESIGELCWTGWELLSFSLHIQTVQIPVTESLKFRGDSSTPLPFLFLPRLLSSDALAAVARVSDHRMIRDP